MDGAEQLLLPLRSFLSLHAGERMGDTERRSCIWRPLFLALGLGERIGDADKLLYS